MAQPLRIWLQGAERDFGGERLDESLAILTQMHEVRHVADALGRLGELAVSESRFDEALAYFDDTLRLSRQLGDPSGVVQSLNQAAEVAYLQADFQRARSLYEECLALSKDLRNQRLIAGMLHNLGNMALQAGQVDRAVALYQESLKIHHELGRGGIATALEGLAEARAAGGDAPLAARIFGVASSSAGGLASTEPFDRFEHMAGRKSALKLASSSPRTLKLRLPRETASVSRIWRPASSRQTRASGPARRRTPMRCHRDHGN
jgi:tetratricopeptide (TPR) repeat protein